MQQTQQPSTNPSQQPVSSNQYVEYRYRWVIVLLMGFSLVVNGMANALIIPITSKLTQVYNLSDAYVSAPIIVSFLVYSLMNFPANQLIDTRGLRVSFLIGTGFYTVGIFLYVMISKGYYYTIMGAILVAMGQPFIINCPAKVATYWFIDKNRTLATSIMTGLLFLGAGIGFVLPPLIVQEDSEGQQAQDEIFYLYAGQFMVAAICFILVHVFMRKSPPTPPSIGARQQKTSLKESLLLIKRNPKLWLFFGGYILLYGTCLSFIATSDLFFKPYGFEDIQIAGIAIMAIVMGVLGSIAMSLFIKFTLRYGVVLKVIAVMSLLSMILICVVLNTAGGYPVVLLLAGVLGFSYGPIVPISYDLGCQLCFPVGEAQVIGILNGGAMIFTFVLTIITTSTISFEDSNDSLIVMIILIVIMGLGTILYIFVKIDLKRHNAEKQGHTISIIAQKSEHPVEIELSQKKEAYKQFIEQK